MSSLDADSVAKLASSIADLTGLSLVGALETRFLSLTSQSPGRALAAARGERAALLSFIEDLTVGETYFFREPLAFEFVCETVIPRLLKARDPSHKINAWCAGCSSGEEPYSLAAVLLDHGLGESISIVGTDLSRAAIAKARAGVYKDWSFRGGSDLVRSPYFDDVAGGRSVSSWVRRCVSFHVHNLARDPVPIGGPFDLIFCRNVLIYIDRDRCDQMIAGFVAALAPGGYLLLGASDPPLIGRADVEVVLADGGVFYRKPADAINEKLFSDPFNSLGFGAAPLRHAAHPQRSPLGTALGLEPAPRTTEQNRLDRQAQSSPQVRHHARAPTPQGLPAELPTKDLFAQAVAAYRAGNYAAAAAAAEALATEAAAELHLRALANLDPQAAEVAAQRWRAAFPDALALMDLQAAILLERGKPADAARVLRGLLYLDRSLAVAHFKLGRVQDRLGDAAAARRSFRNALNLLESMPSTSIPLLSGGETAGGLAALASAELTRLGGSL